jgi:hypothetical protein
VDILLTLNGPETASSLIQKRQWRPSAYGEWLYRLYRLAEAALKGGPFNLRVFPRVVRKNSAELAVF